MAFLTSYRAEKIYFEKLRSNIDIAKSYIQRGATDEVIALLQNAVDADGAIMLCYRNLGEVWADLAAQLEKTQKALEDLKTALEEYHDDLNKKIDGINNYLVRLINALDDRVTILENESKVKFAYLLYDSVEDVYSIQYNGETADFAALSAALEYPHLLVLIDSDSGNIYYPRFVSDVLIDFHADGVSGSDYVDFSVTMTDSDVVSLTEKTVVNYTFGTGFNVSNTNEVTPDLSVLQPKLTEGTGIDIDSNNEISVDFNEVQGKLSSGFGIEIDSDNEISVDTSDVQEKLIAGQNITLTPDSTDPTKTLIEASGGSSYSAGAGINIDSDDVISATGFETMGPFTKDSLTLYLTPSSTPSKKQTHIVEFYVSGSITLVQNKFIGVVPVVFYNSSLSNWLNGYNTSLPDGEYILSLTRAMYVNYKTIAQSSGAIKVSVSNGTMTLVDCYCPFADYQHLRDINANVEQYYNLDHQMRLYGDCTLVIFSKSADISAWTPNSTDTSQSSGWLYQFTNKEMLSTNSFKKYY